MRLARIRNLAASIFRLAVTLHAAAVLRIADAQTLPAPPTLGSNPAANPNDPLAYIVGGIRYLIFIAFVVLVGIGLLMFAGGLIKEVNEARQRGEWGKFGTFVVAAIFVILIVLAAGWWGSTYLQNQLI